MHISLFNNHFESAISTGHARLIVTPSNVAVVTGPHVTLRCGVDTDEVLVYWYRLNATSEEKFQKVFNGSHVQNRLMYAIDTSIRQQFNLVVHTGFMFSAGTYICVEMTPGTKTRNRSSAELIILGSLSNYIRQEHLIGTVLPILFSHLQLSVTVA